MVGHSEPPLFDFGRGGCILVWAMELKPYDHGGVGRVGIHEIESLYEMINKDSLRERDRAGWQVMGDGNAKSEFCGAQVSDFPLGF